MFFVVVVDYTSYKIFPSYEFSGSLNFSIFFQNLLLIPSIPYGSIRPIWSLMFEWWIYILFGGLVFLYRSNVLGAIAIMLGAYYTFFVNGKGEAGQLGIIWAVGSISAVYFENIALANVNKLVVSILFFISAAVGYAVTLNAYNLFVGTILSFGLLFLAAHKNSLSSLSAYKSTTYRLLAGYSYTLFLTHYTVLSLVWRAGLHGVNGFVLSIIAANLAAIIVAMYTEKHHKFVANWINNRLTHV